MARHVVVDMRVMVLIIVIKLKSFYSGGCKVGDSYIRIPMAVIPGYVLVTSSCRHQLTQPIEHWNCAMRMDL